MVIVVKQLHTTKDFFAMNEYLEEKDNRKKNKLVKNLQ